jgi:hypothetical protein
MKSKNVEGYKVYRICFEEKNRNQSLRRIEKYFSAHRTGCSEVKPRKISQSGIPCDAE